MKLRDTMLSETQTQRSGDKSSSVASDSRVGSETPAGTGFIVVDRDLNLSAADEQVRRWFPHIDFARQGRCFSVLRGDHLTTPCEGCPVLRTLADGEPHDAITQHVTGEGRRRFHLSASPICDDSGTVASAAGALREITDEGESRALLRIQRDLAADLAGMSDVRKLIERVHAAVMRIESVAAACTYAASEASQPWNLIAFDGFGADCPPPSIAAPATLDQPIWTAADGPGISGVFPGGNSEGPAVVLPVATDGTATAALEVHTRPGHELNSAERDALEAMVAVASTVLGRIHAEARTRQHGPDIQELFDTLEDFLFVFDMEGRILHANPAVISALGYSMDELKAMGPLDIHPPEDARRVQKTMVDVLAGRTTFCPIPFMTKDGQVVPVETRVALGTWGGVKALFAVSRDISHRERIEERKLRQVIDLVPHMMFARDREGRFILANRAFADFCGVESPKAMLGRKIDEFFPEDTVRRLREADLRIMQTGTREAIPETRTTDAQGRERVLQTIKIPYIAPGTCETTVLGVAMDITQLKDTEDALRASEENLAITLDSIGEAMISADVEGLVTRMNGVAADLTGWSREDAVGAPIEQILRLAGPEDGGPRESRAVRVLRGEQTDSRTEDAILTTRGGERRTIVERASSIRDRKGDAVGVVVVFADVTRQRKVEDQFRQSQKMESIGRLAGGVAHDFNNLLTGILGYSELIESELSGDVILSDYVHTIMETAERGSDLARELLAFSRKTSRKDELVDMHATVENVVKLVRRTVDPRITVSAALNATSHTVMGDRSQLQNALLNLAVNARDAMPDGGTLKITSNTVVLDDDFRKDHGYDVEPGTYLELSVEDTGTGMSRETVARIFEPFFTTKDPDKGTGLGLAMVYGLVQDHGGAINVYSELGHGTAFRILLPLHGGETDEKCAESARLFQGSGRVLLVDDEPIILNMAREMLSSMGYTVVTAENGTDAIEIFRREHRSLGAVVLDLVMPDMDGVAVGKALREIDDAVPAILTSGFSLDGAEIDLAAEGIAGVVEKPYRRAQLSRMLAEHVRATDGAADRACGDAQ